MGNYRDQCPGCDMEDCQDCCEHDFDWDEGGACINCGKQDDRDLDDYYKDLWEDR